MQYSLQAFPMASVIEILNSLFFLSTCLITYVQLIFAGVPLPPHNITITNIIEDSAVVSWDVQQDRDEIKAFGLLHSKIGGNSKTITDLDKGYTSYVLRDLHPATDYLVYMWSVSEEGNSGPSESRQFTTDTIQHAQRLRLRRYLTVEEAFFLTVVLVIWVVVVVLFFRQWGAIRDLQPGTDTLYRQAPKNLKSVEVVKHAKDSVIYHVRPKSLHRGYGGASATARSPRALSSRAAANPLQHPRRVASSSGGAASRI
ncbi:fibronectin type III domain-containing protein 5b-like [Ptychodera flava]|uniref:fibronectin type III domain-containing protein 5b-like n=1 Tax=Ptychodera flava TaxID=63121 RepID=UPI003969EE04